MPERELIMREYYNYFIEEPNEPDLITMDEFISEEMRTDIKFHTLVEEVHFLQYSRITLKNELLTCYGYLQQRGIEELYHAYRAGEELPFY